MIVVLLKVARQPTRQLLKKVTEMPCKRPRQLHLMILRENGERESQHEAKGEGLGGTHFREHDKESYAWTEKSAQGEKKAWEDEVGAEGRGLRLDMGLVMGATVLMENLSYLHVAVETKRTSGPLRRDALAVFLHGKFFRTLLRSLVRHIAPERANF